MTSAAVSNKLETLLKEPGNRACAECGSKQPRWASTNLGVFVCIRCSGIHRNLGVHISKVKSVNLDTWTADLADNMAQWGNDRVNALYEHSLAAERKPQESDSVYTVEAFIRDKYEKKLWMAPQGKKIKKTKPSSESKKQVVAAVAEEAPVQPKKKAAKPAKTVSVAASVPMVSSTNQQSIAREQKQNSEMPDLINLQTMSSAPSAPKFEPDFSQFNAQAPSNNEGLQRFFVEAKTDNASSGGSSSFPDLVGNNSSSNSTPNPKGTKDSIMALFNQPPTPARSIFPPSLGYQAPYSAYPPPYGAPLPYGAPPSAYPLYPPPQPFQPRNVSPYPPMYPSSPTTYPSMYPSVANLSSQSRQPSTMTNSNALDAFGFPMNSTNSTNQQVNNSASIF